MGTPSEHCASVPNSVRHPKAAADSVGLLLLSACLL